MSLVSYPLYPEGIMSRVRPYCSWLELEAFSCTVSLSAGVSNTKTENLQPIIQSGWRTCAQSFSWGPLPVYLGRHGCQLPDTCKWSQWTRPSRLFLHTESTQKCTVGRPRNVAILRECPSFYRSSNKNTFPYRWCCYLGTETLPSTR